MRSFEENLRLYAQLTVQHGLAVQPDQEVLISPETDQGPFVRLVAEEAYRAGAKHVEVLWKDAEIALARLRHGSDAAIAYAPQWLIDGTERAHKENAARLSISSADPNLLSEIAPEKIAISSRAYSAASQGVSKLISEMAINWCVVGASSAGWAKRVFPNLPEQEAVAKLWEMIFLSSRVLEADPVSAWNTHCQSLEDRVRWLDSLKLEAVHFTGPGTDLRVGLVEGHLWAGGRGTARNGVTCAPNIPTEEVFTMPHLGRVDGHVCSTKPLSLRGQLVDGIRAEFVGGEAKTISAEKGEDTLLRLVGTDEGARRLGEVALVPASAKVAQTETLFLNTLFDENAASHIAFGACYAENLSGHGDMDEAQLKDVGANSSMIHVDWMIGSAEVDVDGILPDGSAIPLMRRGEWV